MKTVFCGNFALLFIVDISGFTKFITNKEINYNYLKCYEKNRVCNCSVRGLACKLSLTRVVHTGYITLIKIIEGKNNRPEVTVIHRLLKNNIKENQYLF